MTTTSLFESNRVTMEGKPFFKQKSFCEMNKEREKEIERRVLVSKFALILPF